MVFDSLEGTARPTCRLLQGSKADVMRITHRDADDLIDRAIAAQDEHAIKFTEACLREYHLKPHPIYLVAARNACDQLGA